MHLLILRCPWSPSAVVHCAVVPTPRVVVPTPPCRGPHPRVVVPTSRVVVPTQAVSFHVGSGIPLTT